MSTLPARSPAPPPPPGPGDLVRFVEPAGRRRNRVGTVERRIARGRHEGALVVRVAGEARRYTLPAERLRRMGPATPAPAEAPAAEPAASAAPASSEALRLFD